jgi:hypothetical protein
MLKNIIYFLPAQKFPSGGAKVIYKHSNLINKFKINNLSSSIIHYKKKKSSKYLESIKKKLFFKNNSQNFGYKFKDFTVAKNFLPSKEWVNERIVNKNNLEFNKKNDFIIFPEIIAHFAKDVCYKNKIKYAILSQGIYHMHQTNNLKLLNNVYNKAEFLIVTSEDTKKSFLNIYPHYRKKILKINLSVDLDINKVSRQKKNIITCMPRKSMVDFHLLKFFIQKKIPKFWKIIVLENMSNKEIIKYLSLSKIFLSFSNFEGLGLPPIEAAICGNKVIGYTGEGGKEYFKLPLFEKVSKGNIYDFSNKISKNIKNLKKNWHLDSINQSARFKLMYNYSKVKESNSLKKIIKIILKII